jgi:uncharacterized integral membrane protein (TIGR00698 family)
MDAVLALFGRPKGVASLFPGLALVTTIALLAILLRRVPGLSILSPLMVAVLIGMVLGNIWRLPSAFAAGTAFAGRRVLRFAIVLLGFQLSVTQIVAIGLNSFLIVIAVVAVTFASIGWMGRLFGVDEKLAGVLAAGTSICGASAVAAMSTVNEASEEDVAYAMGAVTALGTVLMFVLPVAAYAIGFDSRQFGIWAGASIHEVAQVTGAAFQFSDAAGEVGTIIKLTRVLMLAPLILLCGWWLRRRRSAEIGGASPVGFPLFVLGFVAAVALNSVVSIPPDMRANLMMFTTFLMSMALAALGLLTHVDKLKAKGLRPLVLAGCGTILIVGLSFALIKIVS